MEKHLLQSYRLERVPQDTTLQAWNAADELFLSRHSHDALGRILLLNDLFGVLSIGLSEREPHYWNNSAMATEAMHLNCQQNSVTRPTVLRALSDGGKYDTIIMQLPKSVQFFSFLLEQAALHLSENGKVYVLSMVKHTSAGHIKTMNALYDSVVPGRAEKKARVVTLTKPIYLTSARQEVFTAPELGLPVVNLPGCYGAGGLDQGARVVIKHIAEMNVTSPALDMGCGNGVLSMALLQQQSDLILDVVDESQQALESAKLNLESHWPSASVRYFHSNGMNSLPEEKYRFMVCNPPFHQENTVTEGIATKLFHDLKNHLAAGGECWIVANRHLGYIQTLRKLFQRVELVSNNPKFNLFRCTLPR